MAGPFRKLLCPPAQSLGCLCAQSRLHPRSRWSLTWLTSWIASVTIDWRCGCDIHRGSCQCGSIPLPSKQSFVLIPACFPWVWLSLWLAQSGGKPLYHWFVRGLCFQIEIGLSNLTRYHHWMDFWRGQLNHCFSWIFSPRFSWLSLLVCLWWSMSFLVRMCWIALLRVYLGSSYSLGGSKLFCSLECLLDFLFAPQDGRSTTPLDWSS